MNKTPRFHKCEICEKVYCCDKCFATLTGSRNYSGGQNAVLYGSKRLCNFRCADCVADKGKAS